MGAPLDVAKGPLRSPLASPGLSRRASHAARASSMAFASSWGVGVTGARSYGNVPVLLRRIAVALGVEHLEGLDEAPPRVPRLDHLVHVAALRRHEGIRELLAVLARLLVLERGGVGRPI